MAPLAKFVISNPSHKVMVRKVRAAARPCDARFLQKAPRKRARWLAAEQCRLRSGCTLSRCTVRGQARGGLAARLGRAAAANRAQFCPCARLSWGTTRCFCDRALASGVLCADYPRVCACVCRRQPLF